MKFYLEDVVLKARALRKSGLSAAKIAQELGVSEMTILRWCHAIPSENKNHLKSLQNLELNKTKNNFFVKNFISDAVTVYIMAQKNPSRVI